MKTKILASALATLFTVCFMSAHAQTTAFTYQGQLYANGSSASGIYDLRFAIYDAATNGNTVGSALTNSATSVSNGLFTVMVDFGNVFDGSNRWLEIAVRTNGATDFTTLNNRQQITSAPYAVQSLNAASATVAASANSVSAANVTGTISLAQIPTSVVTNGASGVSISGAFTGNGAGVTNVSFSSIGDNPFTLAFETNFTTAYGVGKQPIMVIAADVNGDGKPDLISANTGDSTLTVLTNNGSGIFGSATYTVGNDPLCVVAADVNGDGKVDLISANGYSTLTILTNNGSGVFGSNATFVGNGQSVAAADVNGDGKVDLITANRNANSATVFTNDGFGNFSSNATYSVGGTIPLQVIAADVNGDGKPDLIFGNFDSGNTATVLTNDGSGHFAFCSSYGGGAYVTDIATADVNSDGKPDLIFTDVSGEITVATNDGSGNFTGTIPGGAGGDDAIDYGRYSDQFATIDFVTAADANGDGKPDLIAIATGNDNNFYFGIITNDGSGNFTFAFSKQIGDGNSNPRWIAATNLNNDGFMDFAVSDYNSNSVTVFAGGSNSVSVLPSEQQVQPVAVGSGIMTLTNGQNNFTGAFTGDGSELTNLNASQISSGTISAAQLPDISQLNGALSIAQLPSAVVTNNESGVTLGGTFSGNGSGLTNLNASQISSGTVSAAQLPSAVVTNNESGVTLGGTFSGNGSGLTNLNASQISSGTVSAARLPSAAVTNNESSVTLSGTFSGNGAGLTNLNASQISSGTFSGNGSGLTNLIVDPNGVNAGTILLNTALLFGGQGSGEGIGSQRTTNGPAKQYSLDFYTSSSQRMTVLLNGNVGIGTNTPGTLLDVAGGIHASGNVIASGTFTGDGSGLTNLNASLISAASPTAANYLFAYDTGSQDIISVNTFRPVSFGQRPVINGWTYGSSSYSFTNAQTGLYLIQYGVVAEVDYPSGTPQVSVDVTANGTEIAGSDATTTLAVYSKAFSMSQSFIASLNSGDVVQLRWTSDSTQAFLENQGNGTTKPSATLTIIRLQ